MPVHIVNDETRKECVINAEKTYPDVVEEPQRVTIRRYYIHPNIRAGYANDEDEETEDKEEVTPCDDGEEEEDRYVLSFDKDGQHMKAGTVFDYVEECKYALATYVYTRVF